MQIQQNVVLDFCSFQIKYQNLTETRADGAPGQEFWRVPLCTVMIKIVYQAWATPALYTNFESQDRALSTPPLWTHGYPPRIKRNIFFNSFLFYCFVTLFVFFFRESRDLLNELYTCSMNMSTFSGSFADSNALCAYEANTLKIELVQQQSTKLACRRLGYKFRRT